MLSPQEGAPNEFASLMEGCGMTEYQSHVRVLGTIGKELLDDDDIMVEQILTEQEFHEDDADKARDYWNFVVRSWHERAGMSPRKVAKLKKEVARAMRSGGGEY